MHLGETQGTGLFGGLSMVITRLTQLGDKKGPITHAHISDQIKDRYTAHAPLSCMYTSGEGPRGLPIPLPPGKWTHGPLGCKGDSWALPASWQVRASCLLLFLNQRTKRAWGGAVSRGHHPLMSGLPWNPQCQQVCPGTTTIWRTVSKSPPLPTAVMKLLQLPRTSRLPTQESPASCQGIL